MGQMMVAVRYMMVANKAKRIEKQMEERDWQEVQFPTHLMMAMLDSMKQMQ